MICKESLNSFSNVKRYDPGDNFGNNFAGSIKIEEVVFTDTTLICGLDFSFFSEAAGTTDGGGFGEWLNVMFSVDAGYPVQATTGVTSRTFPVLQTLGVSNTLFYSTPRTDAMRFCVPPNQFFFPKDEGLQVNFDQTLSLWVEFENTGFITFYYAAYTLYYRPMNAASNIKQKMMWGLRSTQPGTVV